MPRCKRKEIDGHRTAKPQSSDQAPGEEARALDHFELRIPALTTFAAAIWRLGDAWGSRSHRSPDGRRQPL
jgi:hypothetical protein